VRTQTTLRAALEDPALLGSILHGSSWFAWRTLLIASMGEPLTCDEEREAFRRLTGRPAEPRERADEFWAVVGRRGGKTRAAATLAVYVAALADHSDCLAIGERGLCLFIAENTKQAAVAFGYAAGIFENVPMLAELVVNRTADTISLSNSVDLEVRAASFRGLRGPTCVGVIADEACFWAVDDAANADAEILNAVRPSLATTGGPLIVISSPYARRGEVYATHRQHFGEKGDPRILVAQGASRDFNPSLPQAVVNRAYARDPVAASAEYGGAFRSDLEAFVSREVIDAAIVAGRHELPRVEGIHYVAFVDPSGGSADSMTLAVAHMEDSRVVLDLVRERRPPFSPDDVAREFAETLKAYGVTSVRGDRYGGQWPRERLQVHGVEYMPADKPKSDLYRDLLPMLNSGRVELLDHPRLIAQLCQLERRTARGGRDSVDHPPGAHDDIANVVAGAVVYASQVAAQRIAFFPPFVVCGGRVVSDPAWISKEAQTGADRANATRPPSHWLRQDDPWRDADAGPPGGWTRGPPP